MANFDFFLTVAVACLLQVVPADQAYCIAHIVVYKSVEHNLYFPTSYASNENMMNLFRTLIKRFLPSTHKSLLLYLLYLILKELCDYGIDASEFADTWFSRLFVGCLDFTVVLRIIDW